ncbi:MAG: leucyl/phenylalanyl-tRNA--protein transferase [Verrucomicrobia bacterium]|nr:leucyl/phenylalanyl-tRNA--protein transferase [Verrucomicrobiota bacterium]
MPTIIPPALLLEAYRQGVFPMAESCGISWFSPEQRGIIPLDDRFHIPRGLRRSLRKPAFEIRIDSAFRDVMLGCADRESTWIDETIFASYCELHRLGHAHSVECWDDDGLQGGLYGGAIGGAFFGESMFSRKPDASKIALVFLVERLRRCGFVLLDTQWLTPHLARFGAYEIPREDYLTALQDAIAVNARWGGPSPCNN